MGLLPVADARLACHCRLSIVNDCLDLGKLESGKIEFVHAEFSLSEFLNSLATNNKVLARGRHLSFDLEVLGKLPQHVVGDNTRLNQVLTNLLSNSFKFTVGARAACVARASAVVA